MIRVASWTAVGALVVLAGRTLAYALEPSPLAVELGRQAGGPGFAATSIVALTLGVGLSAAVVWVAALGVAERRALESRPLVSAPRLRPWVLAARAAALFVTTSLAFALLESYIHWRAGLGWHGLHCLTGPVHRNAVPILGALSLLGAAAGAALEHVLAWLRRTLAALTRPKLRFAGAAPLLRAAAPASIVRAPVALRFRARPPPLPV